MEKCYKDDPDAPCCAGCDFFDPCNEETCECKESEPHGICYVEPPKYIGNGGGARGVPTWAGNRACRFHPAYSMEHAFREFGRLCEERLMEEEEEEQDEVQSTR